MKLNRLAEVLLETETKSKTLAINLGVTERVVSFWKTNKTQPRITTFFKIAKILNVPPRKLFVEDNPL